VNKKLKSIGTMFIRNASLVSLINIQDLLITINSGNQSRVIKNYIKKENKPDKFYSSLLIVPKP